MAEQPAPKLRLCVLGQVIVGAVLSILLTTKLQVTALFPPSVAVRVMVMLPEPETLVPAAGDCVMITPLQLSTAAAKAV